jgi:3-methyladenine DNA glycosylase/8-oxoguanine DNA glycosylase
VRAGQPAGEGAATAARAVSLAPARVRDGLTRDWHPPFPLNLRLTLLVHRRGPGDPTLRIDDRGVIWRTTLTPDGPGTLRLARIRPLAEAGTADAGTADGRTTDMPTADAGTADEPAAGQPAAGHAGTLIRASAWGEGAAWLLDRLPDLLGARDDPAAFRPAHPRLRDLAAQLPGLRISRTERVLEALVPAVLEQKVVSIEAHRAWRRLLTWYGTPAPGPAPAGMRVVPSAATWQSIPSWDWHRAGVEAVRARTIANAARMASRLEAICSLPGDEADRMLRSLPGIGPWTAAEVRQRACGDSDAVSVGDYHIPALVGWTLAGEVTDDAGMLALLAPYTGQRYRATRLIELGGEAPPRRGPRMSVRDYRAI